MKRRSLTLRMIVGFVLGAVLAAAGFLLAGAGHGSYLPLRVSSAPLAVFGPIAALLGCTVLWAAMAALGAILEERWARHVLIGLIATHSAYGAYAVVDEIWNHLDTLRAIIRVPATGPLWFMSWFYVYIGALGFVVHPLQRNRRPFQFSLRVFLIAIFVSALLLGWFSHVRKPMMLQEIKRNDESTDLRPAFRE